MRNIGEELRKKPVIIGVVLFYYLIRAISAIKNYSTATDYRFYSIHFSLGELLVLSVLAYLYYRDNKIAKWIFLIYVGLTGLLTLLSCSFFLVRGLMGGIKVSQEDMLFTSIGLPLGLIFIYFSLTLRQPNAHSPNG